MISGNISRIEKITYQGKVRNEKKTNYFILLLITNMKTYEKINETSFKVSEVKELSSEINVLEQLQTMAAQASNIRKIVWQAKQLKDTVNKTVDWYNTWVWILNEAKDKCGLEFKKLDPIVIPEGFVLEKLDIESLPMIDIKKET